MARQASRSIHIGYYHKPLDGKTPIFDTATNKWTYAVNPSEALITASVGKLDTVEVKATSALTKAELSENKAIQAQQTADSKVTAEEAVDEVRTQMFEIVPLGGTSVSVDAALRTIQFVEVGADTAHSKYEIFVLTGDPNTPASSATHKWMNYVTLDEYAILQETIASLREQIAAIEKKLGIS